MNYKDTLLELQALLGQPVAVAFGPAETNVPQLVGGVSGVLRRAEERPRLMETLKRDPDTLFFEIGDSGVFAISEETLSAAEAMPGGGVMMTFGSCDVAVVPDPHAEPAPRE